MSGAGRNSVLKDTDERSYPEHVVSFVGAD
jgi:hypothetical protein